MPPSPTPTVMCPVLNQGRFAQQPRSALVGVPQPPEPEALPCQGPACAWYLPQLGQQGQVTGGTCVAVAIPMVLQQVGALLAHHFDTLTATPPAPQPQSPPPPKPLLKRP